MKDLKDLAAKLEGIGKKSLSPKEMRDLGITRHFMERLVKENYLVKVDHGQYAVNNKKKANDNYLYFKKFEKAVYDGDYENAYHILIKQCRELDCHDYDSQYKFYFILLKELLGDVYDFSIIDELYEYTELKKGNMLDDLISFKEAVMSGNYEYAERYLDKYKEKEYRKYGFYHISTCLFSELIAAVNKKKINEQLQREIRFNTEISSFEKTLFVGEYEKAMEYLEKALTFSVDDETLQYKKILETIIEMDKQGTVITGKHIKYRNMDCFKVLSIALEREDYLAASTVIGVCTKENDSSYYRIIKMLLYHIKRVNNANLINQKTKSLTVVKHIDIVEKWLTEGNNEETLDILKKCLADSAYFRYKTNIRSFIFMIEKIERMQKQGELLEDYTYDYSLFSNNVVRLNQALLNEDYKVALSFIGPITFENKSKTFEVMKKIMYKMNALDKKNRELIRLEEKQRLLEKKKQEEEIKHEEIPKEEPPITVIEEPVITVEEEKIEEPFDEAILYDLIYNREYEKAMQLLKIEDEKGDNWSQLYNVTLSLLKQWEKMNNKRVTLGFDHEYASTFSLSVFFEAIRAKDYETAYHILPVAQELARNKSDFEVYKMILEDMLPIAEDIKKLDEVTETINQMMTSLGEENIEDLLQLIEEKITVEKSLGYHYDKDEILVQIIDMILIAQRNKLDSSYFLRLVDKSDFNQNFLLPSIHNGDYLRAKEILLKIDWNNIVNEGKFTFYDLKNIKKLLVLFESTLLKNEISKEVEKVEEIPPIEEPLKGLRVLVKHRYFNEALKEILDGKYQVQDADIIIQLILTELISQNVSKSYEENFAKTLEEGDSLEALRILSEYDGFIENYHLSKNTEKERQMLKR